MSREVTAPDKAREYETIYILKPDVDAEAADRIGSRVEQTISKAEGKLTKVELWGRRKLAYEINKSRRGVYYYLKYLGRGGLVSEIERTLRLADEVLRYQTIVTGNDVPLGDVQVAAEDIKFERLELPPLEDDHDELRELGFVEPERRFNDGPYPENFEEDAAGAAAAAAAPVAAEAAAPVTEEKE